jgi:sugar lactone lactonase YvrE
MARFVPLRRLAPLLLTFALILPSSAHAFGFHCTQMWGSCGHTPGLFDLVSGITLDGDGNVYVIDRNTERVQKFDADGNYLLGWELTLPANPYAITVDGGFVYVAEGGGHRVLKFTTEGEYVTEWGGQGNGDGQFDTPLGIVVGPDHNVYVSDQENHRIQKFTPNGVFIMKWGSQGAYEGLFYNPGGSVFDADGYLHIVDRATARINVFTSEGEYVRSWGYPHLGFPIDIDIDADGNFYIADSFYHQISKFSPGGVPIDGMGSFGDGLGQMRYPTGVAVNDIGQVYAASYQNCRALRFDPCPVMEVTDQPEPLSLPYGSTAVFSLTAPSALSYHWVRDNQTLYDGPRISGAETATLTITSFEASDEGNYWCSVTNVCGQGNESDHVALTQGTIPSCFGPPAPPPTGMAAWWAMDDGPGNTIPDVLHPVGNKNHASLTGAASLVSGKVGTAVRCDGVDDGLHVPSTLSPRLAATSTGLSIDAWILPRSGSSASAYRMILQKGLLKKTTVNQGGITALAPGYAFYLRDGRMGFQMPNLDYEPVAFEPPMAAMSMDEWHHVAVTIQPQVTGGGKFYLDGVEVASFTPPSGILGNLADLYIGRLTPQQGPDIGAAPFNGDIDEVEIFVTAIGSTAVNKIWSAGCTGKRRVQVLANAVTTIRENTASADVCFAIQNLSSSDRNYSWSMAASGPAVGCPSSVPVSFTPPSGNVLVPAGQSVDLSATASVSPGALTAPLTRCYTLTVTDLGDNGVITAGGTLAYTGEKISGNAACTPPDLAAVPPSPVSLESRTGTATFTLFNDGPIGVTVPWSIRTRDPETGGASSVLRLEGQAAGVPWSGSQFVPANGSAPVPVSVALDEYEPTLRDEIVLAADLDGDLTYDDDLASTHVASGVDTSLALVGVGGVAGATARGLSLRATPNPFGSVTTLAFRIAHATRVEVDVHDVTGRRVRRVTSARLEAGDRQVIWDGRDDAGAAVAAGVYLARVRAGAEEGVVRVLRLR